MQALRKNGSSSHCLKPAYVALGFILILPPVGVSKKLFLKKTVFEKKWRLQMTVKTISSQPNEFLKFLEFVCPPTEHSWSDHCIIFGRTLIFLTLFYLFLKLEVKSVQDSSSSFVPSNLKKKNYQIIIWGNSLQALKQFLMELF